jgi:hypothetical protein
VSFIFIHLDGLGPGGFLAVNSSGLTGVLILAVIAGGLVSSYLLELASAHRRFVRDNPQTTTDALDRLVGERLSRAVPSAQRIEPSKQVTLCPDQYGINQIDVTGPPSFNVPLGFGGVRPPRVKETGAT